MTDPFASIATPAQPATPPPTSGGDPFAAIAQPTGQSQPAQQPQSPAVPLSQHLGLNPGKEGAYQMAGPNGETVSVPHSKVPLAQQNGYNFAGESHFNPWWLVPGSTMGKKRTITDAEATYNRNQLEAESKRFSQDPNSQQLARQSGVVGLETGATREAARTAVGLHDLAGKVGIGNGAPKPGEEHSAIRQFADEPHQGLDEGVGAAAEGMGEFFTGEELLGLVGKVAGKGGELMGMGERLKQAHQLAATIEKSPVIAKYLRIGLEAAKQGFVGGAQTFVKTGGDVGAAATAGALTAGISGGMGAVSGALGDATANRATTLEKVGGVDTPIPAEVRNQTPTPQQVAGQQSIKNAAQDVAERHLTEANETRIPPESAPALPARTGPFEFNLRGVTPTEGTTGEIAHPAAEIPRTHSRVPEGGTPSAQNTREVGSTASTVPDRMLKRESAYMHSAEPGHQPQEDVATGAGTLKTQDPNIAKGHIENLNRVIESPNFENLPPEQQQHLLDARREAQQQMAQYHEQVTQNLQHHVYGNEPSSVLRPLDVPGIVRKVGSFTDAADAVQNTAVDGYRLLNDVTGERFNAIREANKEAWNAYKGASGEEAQEAARKAVESTNQRMTELLDGLRGVVDDRMLDGFNDAYRHAQDLRKVAQAVDSTFTGNAQASRRSWEYRGFDGAQLMKNLSRLQQDMGTGRLHRLIGEDNLNTLFQVAELNRTQTQRAQFGQAVTQVARFLSKPHITAAGIGAAAGWKTTHSWEGAAAGAAIGGAAGAASTSVMRGVLTNPKVAKNLIFALQSGARPENYGPFIAQMIQQSQTESAKEKQNNAQ